MGLNEISLGPGPTENQGSQIQRGRRIPPVLPPGEQIALCQVGLRLFVTLISRLAEPLRSLLVIFADSLTLLVEATEIVLGINVSGLGQGHQLSIGTGLIALLRSSSRRPNISPGQ